MYHSQFKQDKFLEDNVFKGYKFGIYMDIGAHDGITINNTLYFEKNNKWNGYNIEPIPEVFDKLQKNRNNNININCAVSNEDKENKDFIYNTGYSEMISGLKENYDYRHFNRLYNEIEKHGGKTEILKVETKKLSTLCKDYNIRYINYLSIDVEGAEFDVIKSIDFNIVFIDVIGFENNYPDVSKQIISYLESLSYKVIHNGPDIFMIHKYSKFYS
jgi:FkbM family methyltransferase